MAAQVSATTPIELVEARLRPARRSAPPWRRERLGRPLTFAEKVLDQPPRATRRRQGMERGVSYTDFDPDRVAMQDATAQMALLQFMTAGLRRGGRAVDGALRPPDPRPRPAPTSTSAFALDTNSEVYAFLRTRVGHATASASGSPGSGIIHQVVLENYAFPGGMMIGTDSHTPNAGGLGMVAIGVGGADAVDVMTGFPFNVRWPKLIGVHLTGSLSGWSSPKDVILEVAEILTVEGRHRRHHRVLRTGRRLASRPPARARSATWAPRSAPPRRCSPTTPTWPPTSRPRAGRRSPTRPTPCRATCARRRGVANRAPTSTEVIEIDLDQLAPLINGPHSPTAPKAGSPSVGDAAASANGWPLEIVAALIGSCTNSLLRGHHPGGVDRPPGGGQGPAGQDRSCSSRPAPSRSGPPSSATGCSPTSRPSAATVLANACGPCIGQWERTDLDTVEAQHDRQLATTATSRSATTAPPTRWAFVTSPDTVIALALAGTLDFDPTTDTLTNADGDEVRLEPPVGEVLPAQGFDPGEITLRGAADDGRGVVEVVVRRRRTACSCSRPFEPWDGKDYLGAAGAHEGPGQVHHRPHLGGRHVAEVPRPPREHLAATCSSA